MGESHCEIKVFLKYTLDTIIATLNILLRKISPIHIKHFEYSMVIMNMKLSSHGFPVSQKYN